MVTNVDYKVIKSGLSFLLFFFYLLAAGQAQIENDTLKHIIKLHDKRGELILHINYDYKCVLDYVNTSGYVTVSGNKGVFSSIKLDGKWYTTLTNMPLPEVTSESGRIVIDNILFGIENRKIREKWLFQTCDDHIEWTIERNYPENMSPEDTGFPQWTFDNLEVWTGALMGTGGVAWSRLFDKPDASLGSHTGKVTFWNRESKSCLRIVPVAHDDLQMAVRFSRQPDNSFTLNYTASEEKLRTKNFLSRFIINSQDIWDKFDVRGKASVTYRLEALNYDSAYYRGVFPGLNTGSVSEILNTIARVGVIDENLMGSNNWHIDMGYVCLHEQWISQMGLAINDPDYLDNYRKSLDYYRDNAISDKGNVKDRWGYRIWDSKPGSFNNGFYECQWGDLLDSNTDYVINTSDLFQLNGDSAWIHTHKLSCEKALEFLLQRDSDDDGLIEAFTDSYLEKKGSDWIDVIWASWENAFLNAKLYEALSQWSEAEDFLGDKGKSEYYRAFAAKCKSSFNKPVEEGGFWSSKNKWYVYWRDKDDTIHGDNLVTPVNFMAIAYGICDDTERKKSILNNIEKLMLKEKLFMWPLSFFPYRADEGSEVNFPFPNYENGDIFLAWGEVGTRAYANLDASIAVKYVTNVLNQYEKDGLAFQRYDRIRQEGQGNDILANNCLTVVGLYRNIYGIQPKYNRLFLDPHLTRELNGTKIRYRLRDKYYDIKLSTNDYSITFNSFSVGSEKSFAVESEGNRLAWYNQDNTYPSLVIRRNRLSEIGVKILRWGVGNEDARQWVVESNPEKSVLDFEVRSLKPLTVYSISSNESKFITQMSDNNGRLHFTFSPDSVIENYFELRSPVVSDITKK